MNIMLMRARCFPVHGRPMQRNAMIPLSARPGVEPSASENGGKTDTVNQFKAAGPPGRATLFLGMAAAAGCGCLVAGFLF
jgi:hypothetical protein